MCLMNGNRFQEEVGSLRTTINVKVRVVSTPKTSWWVMAKEVVVNSRGTLIILTW